MKKNITFLLSIFIILAVSLFIFFPTFNLALFGDDWYTFWRYSHYLGPKSFGGYNHLNYLLTPYGTQDIVMGLLRNIYDYNSQFYYLTSLILRLIAAFSLLPVTYYLTKSKLASLFAVLFFSVTPIGFDTTNWVFNMPAFISITFFNLFIYFFLKFRDSEKPIFLIITVILFYLTHVASLIRMTGLLPFVLLIEIFWLLQKPSIKNLKQTFIRMALFLLIFIFISYTGKLPDQPLFLSSMVGSILGEGVKTIQQLVFSGRFDFFFYPISRVGQMIIPDILLSSFLKIYSIKLLVSTLIISFAIYIAIILFLVKVIKELKIKHFIKISGLGFFLMLTSIFVYYFNQKTFSPFDTILLLIGFYTILTGVVLLVIIKDIKVREGLFIALSWTILSFIFTWLRAPDTIMPTVHRYLIVSAVGIALLLAMIISIGKNLKSQIQLFCLSLILLILHLVSTQKYINELLNLHSQEISNKIWSNIPYIPQVESSYPVVFYLEDEGNNAPILHTALGFCLDCRIAVQYGINDPKKFPIVMDNWQNVISAVTDGKSFAPYGYRLLKPVPINHVYAFRLEGKDNLINMTDQARRKLSEIVQ